MTINVYANHPPPGAQTIKQKHTMKRKTELTTDPSDVLLRIHLTKFYVWYGEPTTPFRHLERKFNVWEPEHYGTLHFYSDNIHFETEIKLTKKP